MIEVAFNPKSDCKVDLVKIETVGAIQSIDLYDGRNINILSIGHLLPTDSWIGEENDSKEYGDACTYLWYNFSFTSNVKLYLMT